MTKIIYLFTTLLFLSISVSFERPGLLRQVTAAYQSGGGTKVTANIPSKVDIRIYGYTAPNSLVQATSIRVFAQVSSDKDGYFIIDPLPVSREATEICLTTIDSQMRSGFPLCVALPARNTSYSDVGGPNDSKPTEIGPLLLSPTISLSQNTLVQNQKNQSTAQGVSLPDAEVEISFFENSDSPTALTDSSTIGHNVILVSEERAHPGSQWDSGQARMTTFVRKILQFIPSAEAKEIPKITTKTDSNGSYSINLPVAKAVTYRLFARSFYLKNPTPKSQTLSYDVISFTDYWIRNTLPRLLLFILLLAALSYLLYWEKKTGKGRLYWVYFSERQLKPSGVRLHLTLRRLWYNFQGMMKKDQI